MEGIFHILKAKPEEYSMTPNKWVSKIYQAFTKYHNTIFMFGDTNQCDPVEKVSQIYIMTISRQYQFLKCAPNGQKLNTRRVVPAMMNKHGCGFIY